MDALTFRPATAADVPRLNAIMMDPPGVEWIRIAGSHDKAVRASEVLASSGLSLNVDQTTVAEVDGEVVGFVDAGVGRQNESPTPGVIARILLPLLRVAGPGGIWRLLRSRPAWGRVSFDGDPQAYYIAEFDVASSHRNRGIGARLLALAEEQARESGAPRMTLTTTTDNPAQHLYTRSGFAITGTKTDAEYEAYTGSPGRVFMVKELV